MGRRDWRSDRQDDMGAIQCDVVVRTYAQRALSVTVTTERPGRRVRVRTYAPGGVALLAWWGGRVARAVGALLSDLAIMGAGQDPACGPVVRLLDRGAAAAYRLEGRARRAHVARMWALTDGGRA